MLFGIRFNFALHNHYYQIIKKVVLKIQFYINNVSHLKLVHKIYFRNSVVLIVVQKITHSLATYTQKLT